MQKVNSIRFEGYKSFPTGNPEELMLTPYVSVLIGKNNSGKSSCMDVLEYVFDCKSFSGRARAFPKVSVSFELDDEVIGYAFQKSYGGGDVPGNHYDYGKKFVGKYIYADLESSGMTRTNQLKLCNYQRDLELPTGKNEWQNSLRQLEGYCNKYRFRRINADRDIVPEDETTNETVEYNGAGATNILRKFVNHSEYDEKLVEETLLGELNKIMEPDSHFANIRVQEIGTAEGLKWEIFLDEGDGRRFALSKSGSGLKTIMLMLINLHIVPATKEYRDREIIFAFEELENNLHPALQRKVFEYLYDFAAKKETHIFITTHSHVAINTYFEKPNTAIYHIQKVNNASCVTRVGDRKSQGNVLTDLDVRASDLFQSNGIIWVEGPSDRIYINRWLKVFCNSEFLEGSDYQFLYYGGKTLSHYTTDEGLTDLIDILTTNRNAAIVIDSDKTAEGKRINRTKTRIKTEFATIGGFCWITKGKEIENYISTEDLQHRFGTQLPALGQYELFPQYIDTCYKNFSNKKVVFAKEMAEFITAEKSRAVLDLKVQIERLYKTIKQWNRKD